MDYFQAVAVFQGRLGPAVAGDDGAVEFYGYTVGLHAQGFDQGREGEEARAGLGSEDAFFSIDVQFHLGEVSPILDDLA